MTRRSSSVTIREVAKEAGVSIATVSRYINQTAAVSPEVASRLDVVMADLKYVPHTTARNLATQKTNAIGLLLTYNIYGDFFAPMLRGIEEVVANAGFNLLISSNLSKYGSTHNPALGPNNTDGILGYADSLTEAGLNQYFHSKFPVVLIYRSAPPHLSIPSVTVENKAASKAIVDHLIEVPRHAQELRDLDRGQQAMRLLRRPLVCSIYVTGRDVLLHERSIGYSRTEVQNYFAGGARASGHTPCVTQSAWSIPSSRPTSRPSIASMTAYRRRWRRSRASIAASSTS